MGHATTVPGAVNFDEFAGTQLRPLLGLATALCGDRALAQDLVQDVLIKIHANWPRVDAARDPAAYVRRMLVNEHLSWRRKWARVIPSELRADQVDATPDHAPAHADRDEVHRLLAGLPPKQRAVLALRYYGGLNDAEIAETLGCSAGTVRGYASRALAALRAARAEEGNEQ